VGERNNICEWEGCVSVRTGMGLVGGGFVADDCLYENLLISV
jgi:hypothetical protein